VLHIEDLEASDGKHNYEMTQTFQGHKFEGLLRREKK